MMKTQDTPSLFSSNKPSPIGVFDPVKFAKLIQDKNSKKSWWRRIMDGFSLKKSFNGKHIMEYSRRKNWFQ